MKNRLPFLFASHKANTAGMRALTILDGTFRQTTMPIDGGDPCVPSRSVLFVGCRIADFKGRLLRIHPPVPKMGPDREREEHVDRHMRWVKKAGVLVFLNLPLLEETTSDGPLMQCLGQLCRDGLLLERFAPSSPLKQCA